MRVGGARLGGVRFRGTRLGGARFRGVRFRGAGRLLGAGQGPRFPAVPGLADGLTGTGARRVRRGAGRLVGMHALLLRRLFLISYHQSPPARWWHAPPTTGGIRGQSGGAKRSRFATSDLVVHASARSVSDRSPCRWHGAGWSG
ncbi:pentapeptide repeat-containing protein [Streptomyces sp. NPDC047071]|uniref:pentapeptide repeat-containing protein n=1 Tax=Streptomyces sp. NPDC047071 TaxID=3154808 RepID=UPI0034567E9D